LLLLPHRLTIFSVRRLMLIQLLPNICETMQQKCMILCTYSSSVLYQSWIDAVHSSACQRLRVRDAKNTAK